MDALGKVKTWIGGLTEIGLMLLALAIVAALLVGSNLPFFGNVTGNIMALVKSLGDAGLLGLFRHARWRSDAISGKQHL
jgi:hypothetical protein